MTYEINQCRICGNADLIEVLDLGTQFLTGVFPATENEDLDKAPVKLVKCNDNGNENCGLLQIKHTVDLKKMYGLNYGYRSGLNQSMVKHLQAKVQKILKVVELRPQEIVVDIGSNDCTTLKCYPNSGQKFIGVDPSGIKFKEFYPPYVTLLPDFFSKSLLEKVIGPGARAKIITSIAMFYDLESPMAFVKDIYESLADDGVWIFEQSYMPTMLKMLAYDTACHEHLEYYSLKQIHWMLDRVGLKIIDLEFNDINGGSFSVTAAKKSSGYKEAVTLVQKVLEEERELKLHTLAPYEVFRNEIRKHKEELINFLQQAKKENKKVFAYGASTKGNVLLQYCNISRDQVLAVAEVNENKFGCFTPGTKLPIISENEAKEKRPDYFLVLPWHFKKFIIEKEKAYLASGGKLVFPLPKLEIIER